MVGMLFSIPVANMKLAMVRSPRSFGSARESHFGETLYTRFQHKQPASGRLHLQLLFRQRLARRRDIQPVERRAAERTARWLLDRQPDGPQAVCRGRESANAPAA